MSAGPDAFQGAFWRLMPRGPLGLAAAAFVFACSKHADVPADPGSSLIGSLDGEARVTAGEHGFSPGSLSLAKGGPGSTTTVTFVRTTEKTCATEVAFPELGIQKPLPLNTAVAVNVPTDATRTLTFQCGMGMYKGALVVK